VLYKRLANCDNDQLDDMQQELIDRFGLLPDPQKPCSTAHRLRLVSKPLGMKKIDATETVEIRKQAGCGERPHQCHQGIGARAKLTLLRVERQCNG
jgi:transcription-repair coupling factor (superfamily II helicase)